MSLFNLLHAQRSTFRAAGSPRRRPRANTYRLRLEAIEDRCLPSAFSTYLGGSLDEGGGGIAVDAEGNTYVVGQTT